MWTENEAAARSSAVCGGMESSLTESNQMSRLNKQINKEAGSTCIGLRVSQGGKVLLTFLTGQIKTPGTTGAFRMRVLILLTFENEKSEVTSSMTL